MYYFIDKAYQRVLQYCIIKDIVVKFKKYVQFTDKPEDKGEFPLNY